MHNWPACENKHTFVTFYFYCANGVHVSMEVTSDTPVTIVHYKTSQYSIHNICILMILLFIIINNDFKLIKSNYKFASFPATRRVVKVTILFHCIWLKLRMCDSSALSRHSVTTAESWFLMTTFYMIFIHCIQEMRLKIRITMIKPQPILRKVTQQNNPRWKLKKWKQTNA